MPSRTTADAGTGAGAALLGARAALVLAHLAAPGDPAPAGPAPDALRARLSAATPAEVWFTAAVLCGALPTSAETVADVRLLRADGPAALLDRLAGRALADVEVVVERDRTLVDVGRSDGAADELGSGIVVDQVVAAWRSRGDARTVAWARSGTALVDRSPDAPDAGPDDDEDEDDAPGPRLVVVPWQVPVVVLRAPTDADAAARARALVEHGAVRSGAIGFGEPAITCNDRTPAEAAGAAHALTVLRHVDRLAAVGPVAAEEYEGWREMVRTLDLAGPEVVTVPLADEVPDGPGTDRRVRDVDADPLPLLVSAGGLGPRGNQLLVLRAANTLWRSGLHFQLVLLGYRRDAPAALERQITRLREAGCPVEVLAGTDATQLRAVLERARCLVDVPQHDPIGLHSLVARALGVPVLGGPHGRPPVSVGEGAVTDPDDSTSLAEAIRPFVRPGRPAGRTPRAVARTWQDYADDLWAELAGGSRTAG